jgi:hypothetical protein
MIKLTSRKYQVALTFFIVLGLELRSCTYYKGPLNLRYTPALLAVGIFQMIILLVLIA